MSAITARVVPYDHAHRLHCHRLRDHHFCLAPGAIGATMYIERYAIPGVILASYPDYRGRKFKLTPCASVKLTGAYWDGGSRSFYAAVHLDTGNVTSACPAITDPFAHTDPMGTRGPAVVVIPERTVIVARHVYCGRDSGIEIFARPSDVAPMLPVPASALTEERRIVLHYTRSLKPSYAGISDYRFDSAKRETGISREAWDRAKAALIASKHLTKAGAITNLGRNAPRAAAR